MDAENALDGVVEALLVSAVIGAVITIVALYVAAEGILWAIKAIAQ